MYCKMCSVIAKCLCAKYFSVQSKFYYTWSKSCVKMLIREPEARNCAMSVLCRLRSCIKE